MVRSLIFASVALAGGAVAAPGQWTAYDDAEMRLTDAYLSMMHSLPQTERTDLRDSERAWIASRNRACGHETRNACATRLTEARALQLDRQWIARFRPRVGQCFSTTVKEVGTRLEGDSDQNDGASISYADGHSQVDYESSPRKLGFRPGDPVRLCVVSLPKGCPVGDHRGIVYRATDLATRRVWTATDSEHACGGA